MSSRQRDRFPRYTSVANRKANAAALVEKLANKEPGILPVLIEGRLIARSFWGKAWCSHLEQFSDFSNRLPRGRSYVRSGSVIDLKIAKGSITARVAGSSVYQVKINIATLPVERWEFIKEQCAGGIGSALELLQGQISNQVMQTVCDRDSGLFPHPVDIKLDCNCPDWASLCKHLAAVLYGVGARLDESPELLFLLRGVDHQEMIEAELAFDTNANVGAELKGDLSEIFGIEIDSDYSPAPSARAKKKTSAFKRKSGRVTSKKTAPPKRKIPTSKLAKKRVPKKRRIVQVASGIDISRGFRASHIKKLRKNYDLSIAEIAALIGVSPATVSRWEKQTGVINTREATLNCVTRVFAMSYSQMIRKLSVNRKR